ncbi:hypothetical protein AAGW05_04265 [Arthrobacter sp. LAPM80]
MEPVLRFWLVRSVDGFRLNVVHGMVKAANLEPPPPFIDDEGVHEIYLA